MSVFGNADQDAQERTDKELKQRTGQDGTQGQDNHGQDNHGQGQGYDPTQHGADEYGTNQDQTSSGGYDAEQQGGYDPNQSGGDSDQQNQ